MNEESDRPAKHPADPSGERMERTLPTPRVPLEHTLETHQKSAVSIDTVAVLGQMGDLRGQLERTLSDLELLIKVASLFADEQESDTGLTHQLRAAAGHIENALDELMPPED
jgi:hypothetical protein